MENSFSDYIFDRASPEDAKGIAFVHVKAWQESYQELLPKELLDSLPSTMDRRVARWRECCRADNKNETVIIVKDKKSLNVVGFCVTEQGRDEKFKDKGEIAAIYLLKSHQGKGLGLKLLQEGLK